MGGHDLSILWALPSLGTQSHLHPGEAVLLHLGTIDILEQCFVAEAILCIVGRLEAV